MSPTSSLTFLLCALAILMGCGARSGLLVGDGNDATTGAYDAASSDVASDGMSDGIDVTDATDTPVVDAMPPDDTPVVISLGNQHACALDGDRVRCWGFNGNGQLGDGTTTDRLVPVTVTGLSDVVEVAAGGNTSCARKRDDTVFCWGAGAFGQLGSGTFADLRAATPLGLTSVAHIAVGAEHACAVRRDGTVWCWGNTAHGAIGSKSGVACEAGVCNAVPARVAGIDGAVTVETGWAATCAIVRDGHVWCWGRNQFGQLGDGSTLERATPAPASGLQARDVGLGVGHACALLNDGSVSCWGSNMWSKLGFKDPGSPGSPGECRNDLLPQFAVVPRTVPGLEPAVSLAVGANHSCVARIDGTANCWGQNFAGELGDGRSSVAGESCRLEPQPVVSMADAKSLASGAAFSCAIGDGGPWCWGKNLFGQLGDGTVHDRYQPTAVKW